MRIEVHVRCPACGYEWLEAIILTETWWGNVTPESCAARVRCRCGGKPDVVAARHEGSEGTP